jgi:hypothetical protein
MNVTVTVSVAVTNMQELSRVEDALSLIVNNADVRQPGPPPTREQEVAALKEATVTKRKEKAAKAAEPAAPVAPAITIDDLKKAARALGDNPVGFEKTRVALAKFGVKKLPDVKPADYAALLVELQADAPDDDGADLGLD